MGSPRLLRSDKTCIACGEPIVAAQYTDSLKTWAQRKFCTQICRFDFNAGRSANPFPAHSTVVAPEIGACREHLRALVRAGLRQGYLYSLPPADLHSLAQELRIAA